ncbi:MAG: hypothetical protein ACM31C_16260, partial [Acidobacteriota bacterium]
MGRVDLLQRAPLFAALPRTIVEALAARAVRRRVRRRQRIDAGRSVIVLVAGRIEIVDDAGAVVGGR